MNGSNPAPSAEALLAHWPFVRALARRLVHESDADDVAQETMLTALQKPPRGGGSLRGWLASVARNVARQGWRSDARRQRREDAVRVRDAALSTAELVERESQRRLVADAVIALEEPYRSAVVLRYFEGLKPGAIAERLGIPVETVRTRLKRAVGQLREQLDARHGGDRKAWSAALLPLAGLTPERTAVAAGTAATAATTAAGIGLMHTSHKLGIAALVLLLGGAGFWALDPWGDGGAGRAETSPPALAPPVIATPTPEAASGEPAARLPAAGTEHPAPAAGDAPAATPAPAGDGALSAARETLRGVVTGLPEGLENGEVIVAGEYDKFTDGQPEPRRVAVGRDGRFVTGLDWLRKHGPNLEFLRVEPSLPASVGAAVKVRVESTPPSDGEAREYTAALTVAPAATISGRLIHPDGKPIANHNVALNRWGDGAPEKESVVSGQTDAHGVFRLAVATSGEYVFGCAPHRLRHFVPYAKRVTLDVGRDEALGEIHAERGLSISGRVAAPGGLTPNYASVNGELLGAKGTPFQVKYSTIAWHQGRAFLPRPSADVAKDGTFNMRGLRPGRYRLRPQTHGGLSSKVSEVEVDAPAGGVVLSLPFARLEVEFFLNGEPFHEPFSKVGWIHSRDGKRWRSGMPVMPDEPFRSDVKPGQRGILTYQLPGYAPFAKELVFPAAGETLRVRIDLKPEKTRGAVEFQLRGTGTATLRTVYVTSPDGEVPSVSSEWNGRPVKDGAVRIAGLKAGRWKLYLYPGRTGIDEAFWCGAEVVVDIRGGETVRRELELHAGGRLRFSARDEAGEPLWGDATLRDAEGRMQRLYLWSRRGSSWSSAPSKMRFGDREPAQLRDALKPGRYTLTVERDGYAPQTKEFEVVAGELHELEFVLLKQ